MPIWRSAILGERRCATANSRRRGTFAELAIRASSRAFAAEAGAWARVDSQCCLPSFGGWGAQPAALHSSLRRPVRRIFVSVTLRSGVVGAGSSGARVGRAVRRLVTSWRGSGRVRHPRWPSDVRPASRKAVGPPRMRGGRRRGQDVCCGAGASGFRGNASTPSVARCGLPRRSKVPRSEPPRRRFHLYAPASREEKRARGATPGSGGGRPKPGTVLEQHAHDGFDSNRARAAAKMVNFPGESGSTERRPARGWPPTDRLHDHLRDRGSQPKVLVGTATVLATVDLEGTGASRHSKVRSSGARVHSLKKIELTVGRAAESTTARGEATAVCSSCQVSAKQDRGNLDVAQPRFRASAPSQISSGV